VPAGDFTHSLQRLECAGGCFRLDQGNHLDRLVRGKGGFHLLPGEDLPPGLFDPFHHGAVERRHLAHPLAEKTVAADEDRVARFRKIAEGGFHARAPGSGDGKGQFVLGPKNGPEQGLFFIHQGEPLRIHVSDKRRAHRAQDAGMSGAWSGTEKETMRYVQIIDCRRHNISPPICILEKLRS